MKSICLIPFAKYDEDDQVKEEENGRACSTNGEGLLMRNPERKGLLGRPRHKWVNDVKSGVIGI
jgi:hypothetical protein